jgi:biotin carboxylase
MIKILATNTGDTAITRSLIDDPDVDVVFVTEERFVDQYPPEAQLVFVPTLNDPAETATVAALRHDLGDRTHVIGITERSSLAAAYLRSYLGLPGASVEAVLNCTNKYAMKKRFREAGMRTADFALAGDRAQVRHAAESLGWPVIVKPLMGAGVDATRAILDEMDWNSPATSAFFERLEAPRTTSEKEFPVVVESYLPVEAEYHCDGLVAEGRILYWCVSRYLRPVLAYEGTIFGSETLSDDHPTATAVARLHEQALAATGLRDAATHFEVLQVGGQLYSGELAARPGGGGIRRMLQLRDGINMREAHVAASLTQRYEWEPVEGARRWAQIMLPARRGEVVAISEPADLAHIPGVVEVDMRLKAGDTVSGLMDSSTVSGLVYANLEATTTTELVQALESAFRMDVRAAA